MEELIVIIDWTKPLEVVNADTGEAYPIGDLRPNNNKFWPFVAYSSAYGDDFYINNAGGEFGYVNSGMSTGNWTIRNTAPNPIPADIAERMRELVERMSGRDYLTDLNTEAKAIMEALKRVDPDIAEALAIVKLHYPEMKTDYRGRRYDIALAAIAKGRSLERGGE